MTLKPWMVLVGNARAVPAGSGLPCSSTDTVGGPARSMGSTFDEVNEWPATWSLIL